MCTSRVHVPLSLLSSEGSGQHQPAVTLTPFVGSAHSPKIVLPHPHMCTSRVHVPLSLLSSEVSGQHQPAVTLTT